MNRGVMVIRGDPDVKELVFSAQGICSDKENDLVKGRLEPYFDHLAKAYKVICEKQKREFFGLRDFYRYVGNSNYSQFSLLAWGTRNTPYSSRKSPENTYKLMMGFYMEGIILGVIL